MLNQTSSGETIKKTDGNTPTRMQKATSLDWLGQTLASLCWIISVFVYVDGDLSSMANGDWLQLAAASCWMASNIASLLAINPDK